MVEGRTQPIRYLETEATGRQDLTGDIITVENVEQVARQFSGRFCVYCEALLKASLRLQIAHFYS